MLRRSGNRSIAITRAAPSRKGLRIANCPTGPLLFVDDEEGIRATLPLLLRARGFDVRVAANVAEALLEMRTHNFDVLLSDLNIGKDDDGFTVVQAMRSSHPTALIFY